MVVGGHLRLCRKMPRERQLCGRHYHLLCMSHVGRPLIDPHRASVPWPESWTGAVMQAGQHRDALFGSFQSKASAISACAAGSIVTCQVTGVRRAIAQFQQGFCLVLDGYHAKSRGFRVHPKLRSWFPYLFQQQTHPTGLPPVEGVQTCQAVQWVAVLVSYRKV